MAKTTRTLNPLHFEDLEPHRFEDMIRQLIYDFRDWRSIEAVGRSGNDEGIDIRATEGVVRGIVESERDDHEEVMETEERTWVIQCKRERRIGPSKLEQIVSDGPGSMEEPPYGYIIAAACDFSKQTRDRFRARTNNVGIEETRLWGKGELEDLLFLPKNDHLLFAYFGISLQYRRRSLRTELRSKLALKRRLVKNVGDLTGTDVPEPVLIRDPDDAAYPHPRDVADFLERRPWRYFDYYGQYPLDHVCFISRRFYAYADWETQEWDALLDYDTAWHGSHELFGVDRWGADTKHDEKGERYRKFWNTLEKNRAYCQELRSIPFERIVGVDDIGDAYNPAPHLLVERRQQDGDFFEPRTLAVILPASGFFLEFSAEKQNRVKYFPEEIPDVSDEEGPRKSGDAEPS